MVDVFKVFYATHYNFAAVSVLLLLILIFLLSKKNIKVGLVILAALIAVNVAVYKKTFNRAWTIELEPEKVENNGYTNDYVEPKRLTFSVNNWEIVDDKGVSHHWCWVEDLWEVMTNTDIVAWIWGENAGKKVKQSTESRVDAANSLGD